MSRAEQRRARLPAPSLQRRTPNAERRRRRKQARLPRSLRHSPMMLTPGEPDFRPAELRDVEALVRMRFSLLYESHFAPEGIDRACLEDSFRAYFSRHIPSGEFIGWVADAEGSVVGTGGMVFWHK